MSSAVPGGRRRLPPLKEGEDGAGMADPVAIVEMIGAGIVEVHRLLDEAQPDDARVEIQTARGLAGNGRDVMNARHGSVLHERGYEGRAVILLLGPGNGASPRIQSRNRNQTLVARRRVTMQKCLGKMLLALTGGSSRQLRP